MDSFLHGLLYFNSLVQIYDVVRYRMHRMKKKLKDELDSRNMIQEYICPNCSKRYQQVTFLVSSLILNF